MLKFFGHQKVKCHLFWFGNGELLHSMSHKQYIKCHKALWMRGKVELSFGRWSYWATEQFSCRKTFVQSQHWLVCLVSVWKNFLNIHIFCRSDTFSANSLTAVFSAWKYLFKLFVAPSHQPVLMHSSFPGDTRDVFAFCRSWNEIQSSFSISLRMQLPRPASSLPHFCMYEC